MKCPDVLMPVSRLVRSAGRLVGWFALVFGLAAAPVASAAFPADELDRCNVVWTTPSHDSAGSMPLGNGEVGINLWVEEGGDLRFYISRSDSYSEISRLIKVGEVRVALEPNPFTAGAKFRQELRLRDGCCEITAGSGSTEVKLRVFVDADRPVVRVLGESASPVKVRAVAETWRAAPRVLPHAEHRSSWTMHDPPAEIADTLIESADVFPEVPTDAVAWYHRNETSVEPFTLKHQGLDSVAGLTSDPLLHRTFGGWMQAKGFKAQPGHVLASASPVNSFDLCVATPCIQADAPRRWLELAAKTAAEAVEGTEAARRTAAWWHDFWERSWVFVAGDHGLGIPVNSLPLRIGMDSRGSNLLPGYLGRAGIYNRALDGAEIIALAGDRDVDNQPRKGLLKAWPAARNPQRGFHAEFESRQMDFANGLTVEAWFKLEDSGTGRIFDKITATQTDGFLLDALGGALRFMVGHQVLKGPAGALTAGQWHHVAGTVDPASGAMTLYQDGRVVAEKAGGGDSAVSRGYNLQRYVQACGGRGFYPIKFNGGIFTVEPKDPKFPFNADFRNWGDCHWWQNVRMMYHPMMAAGDFDMMEPLFRLYAAVLPICEARVRIYHHAQGAYFPETMTVWGSYANADYGWDRAGHETNDVKCVAWRWAWNQGPELVALMLDRWEYTRDEEFAKKSLLPMARSVLLYFDTRFRKDQQGKIVIDPAQSVESLQVGVTNDTPTIAGLIDICDRLGALPAGLVPAADREFFARMKGACPPLPVAVIRRDGRPSREIVPAAQYVNRRNNVENPELYPIWPLHLYGVGKPDLEMARATYAGRRFHHDVGWGYDGSAAARLGLTNEAARILTVKCANSNPAYRWPATWGPNYDWLPDQNHGGNLLETAQLMLLQSDGDKLFLLPAWPKTWDVSFKLHAPNNTVVECVYRHGKMEKLEVTPAARRKDIVFAE